jgi:hypothetical protein
LLQYSSLSLERLAAHVASRFSLPFAHNQDFSRDSMKDAKHEDRPLSFCAHPITMAKEHLLMSPGNANFPNGVMQTANREIGVPGF